VKVLIVDDDFVSRSLIQTILEHSGVKNIDPVVSGSEAVEAYELALDKGEPYQLIFLDMVMPHEDGFSALRKIRELEKKLKTDRVKVIVVSSLEEQRQKDRAYSEECDRYIVKPVTQEKVTLAMSELGVH